MGGGQMRRFVAVHGLTSASPMSGGQEGIDPTLHKDDMLARDAGFRVNQSQEEFDDQSDSAF